MPPPLPLPFGPVVTGVRRGAVAVEVGRAAVVVAVVAVGVGCVAGVCFGVGSGM